MTDITVFAGARVLTKPQAWRTTPAWIFLRDGGTSWQGTILNQVLKRTMKPMMFSGRLTRARMGISAWALEASAGLVPTPAARITPLKGAVRGEWVEAEERSSTVILYMHGGAYIAGSPRTHRPLTAELARSTGARVLALDYRQAPEHAYPAWLEDGVAAYQHLLKSGERPQHIVLAGDSAGGNLVLVTLLRLKEPVSYTHLTLPTKRIV